MSRGKAGVPRTGTYGAADFAEELDVSRETLARLEAYVSLLLRWNARINLIGRNTEADIWRRHILDCAQLLPLLPASARSIADIGTGAGLPGLILSIFNNTAEFHLIESDQRKCAFLREAIRVTQSTAIIHESRVEQESLGVQDVVVARACAPLDRLLEMAQKLISIHTRCLFLKGAQAELELTEARAHWNMQVRQVPSRTDRSGRILILTEVVRARA